jgi:hypothetical protein
MADFEFIRVLPSGGYAEKGEHGPLRKHRRTAPTEPVLGRRPEGDFSKSPGRIRGVFAIPRSACSLKPVGSAQQIKSEPDGIRTADPRCGATRRANNWWAHPL